MRQYSEDLHYQASMVQSTYGVGELKGQKKALQQVILNYCKELDIEPISEKTLKQSFLSGLESMEQELFTRIKKKQEEKAAQEQKARKQAEAEAAREREARRKMERELAALKKQLGSDQPSG